MEEIVNNEFEFYAKLAKPLVLNLPKSQDRILAAAWIKKFRDEASGDEKLRTIYLKLLLFCLQRRKLSGIFADDPSEYDTLEALPEGIDLNEFARNLLDQERNERAERIRREMMGDMEVFPLFTTDCSPDLTEYVAAQDIPNFGVHAYYAISKQPVNKWQRAEKAILPKGTKSAVDTTAAGAAAAAAGCVCSPKGTASAPEVEEAAAEGEEPECKKKKPDKGPEKKKRRPKKLGTSPPTHPIGEVTHPVEERPTPTWGTNLIEIRDRTDIGNIEEPTDAEKALEEQVSKMMEEEEAQAESEDEGPQEGDTIASKANEMINVLDEFKHGKMDKPKKPPSRLAKLGDRSRVKAPKSIKAPKIAVKGMKKGKGKGDIGPKPANLPEEFADWTEKDLKEAGLTWADLMPVEENIDDELQRIEDEGMGATDGEDDFPIEVPSVEEYEGMDLDAMIREAEAELAAERSMFDDGVDEDEPIVELFDDEFQIMQEKINVSRTAEELRGASPAITSGIPVTTPKRSASPKRFSSPEKVYAEEDDDLLQHRASPLRPPKPKKREVSFLPKRATKPSKSADKDPNIAKVFKKAKKLVRQDSFEEHEKEFEDEDEFERLEKQFDREDARSRGPGSGRRSPSPAQFRNLSFSPGAEDRARQRAQQQEQLLRTPGKFEDEDEFERLEKQFEREAARSRGAGSCRRSPSPAGFRNLSFSPGAEDRARQRAQQQEQLLRTPEPDVDLLAQQFEGEDFSWGNSQLATCASPPGLTEDEEFEMMEDLYRQQALAVGEPVVSQLYDYHGVDDFGMTPKDQDDSLGLLSPGQVGTPRMPGRMYEEMSRQLLMNRAGQQEALLRQGSPEANRILQEAERTLEEDLFNRAGVGEEDLFDRSGVGEHQLMDESLPPSFSTPPPFSPSSPLDEAELDDLGVIPELVRDFSRAPPPRDYGREMEEEMTDIFDRCGGLGRENVCPAQSPQAAVRSSPIPSPFQDMSLQPQPQPRDDASFYTPPGSPCPGSGRAATPQRGTPPPPTPPSMPFFPGMSAPMTPVRQRPVARPAGYMTPDISGAYGPQERPRGYMTPIPSPVRQYGPRDRPALYATPESMQYGDFYSPEHFAGMDLGDVEMPDFGQLPPETPRVITPCGAAEPMGRALPESGRQPGRVRPAAATRRAPPTYPGQSPVRPGMPMEPRKLFGKGYEDPVEPVPSTPQARTPVMIQRRRKRRKARMASPGDDFEEMEQRFEKEETRIRSPCRRAPRDLQFSPSETDRVRQKARAQENLLMTPPTPADDEFEQLERQFQAEMGTSICPGSQRTPPGVSPGDVQAVREKARLQEQRLMQPTPGTPRAGRPMPSAAPARPSRPPRVGTPTGQLGMRARKLDFRDESRRKVLDEPAPAPCARTPPGALRPPSDWSTPEGMSGPSRRPTGQTPPFYNSDFVSPPPSPQRSPRFAPAKRIKKKGKYPPPPPPPMTPGDQRRMPSPCQATPQRVPCGGGLGTPARRGPRMMKTRLFEEPGERPRLPSPESPTAFSPFTSPEYRGVIPESLYDRIPNIEDEGAPEFLASPVCRPQVDQPPASLPRGSPDYLAETMPEHLYADIPFLGDEPIPELASPVRFLQDDQMYFPPECLPCGSPENLPTMAELQRHQVVPDRLRTRISHQTPFGRGPGPAPHRESVSAFRQMDRIHEYGSDDEWRRQLLFDADLETYDKYYQKPVESFPAVKKPKHFTYPPPEFQSPRVRAASPPLDVSGYGDAFEEVWQANLRVPPERYPPPEQGVCPAGRPATGTAGGLGSSRAYLDRAEEFAAHAEPGKLEEYLADRALRDIADQGDLMFDYEGGLLDTSPPPGDELGRNYYPDISRATQRLITCMQDYSLPESPDASPCMARTPPGIPPGSPRTPPSIPSGSPRTPPPRQVAAAAPCPGAARAIPKGQPPPKGKQLRETRSSQLRKEAAAKQKKAEEQAQKKKERAEEKRKQAKAKMQAEIRAQRKAEAADRAEGVGPEFLQGVRQHEVQFPGYEPGHMVKSRYRPLHRSSADAFRQMGEIGEEPTSPCGTCGGRERQPEVRMRSLQEGRESPDARSPVLAHLEGIEHVMIHREPERRGRAAEVDEAAELGEFEELERQMMEDAGDQVRPGAGPPRGRALSPWPAQGITYSPPRPQSMFEIPAYQNQGGYLPIMSLSGRSSPTPPTPPSPPPLSPDDLDLERPPVFFEMDPEDRLPYQSPARAAGRSATPPCPPSPPLDPALVRQQVESMAKPTFDPGLRGDILPRAQRRAIRGPCGMADVREEEPLIPCLAGEEPARESRGARRRRDPEQPRKRKKKRPDDEMMRYIRGIEERYNLPPEESPEGDYNILDESLSGDIPSPMRPYQSPCHRRPARAPRAATPRSGFPFTPPEYTDMYVPPEDLPIHPDLVDLAGYEPPLNIPPGVCPMMDEQPGEDLMFTPPRYPETDEMELDREAMLRWQPPNVMKNIWLAGPEDLGMLTPPSVGRGPCGTYTPAATPPLQLLDEAMLRTPAASPCREDIEDFFDRTPPLETVTSMQELRYRTMTARGKGGIKPRPQYFGGYGETPQRPVPRWHGRGGARNVIPEVDEPYSPPTPGTPPPQLPEPPSTWSPTLDEFERLERETTCRGRRGKSQRQVDFNEQMRRTLIDEMEEEFDRAQAMSPGQREFEQLEQQAMEQPCRVSRRRQQQVDFAEIQRRADLEDMAEEVDRRQAEFARPPSPAVGRAFTPPGAYQNLLDREEGAMEGYQSPEPLSDSWRALVDECQPCGSPDYEGVERQIFDEMGGRMDDAFIDMEMPDDTELWDQGMLGDLEGYQSPPPLSPGPCFGSGPPAAPYSPQRIVEDQIAEPRARVVSPQQPQTGRPRSAPPRGAGAGPIAPPRPGPTGRSTPIGSHERLAEARGPDQQRARPSKPRKPACREALQQQPPEAADEALVGPSLCQAPPPRLSVEEAQRKARERARARRRQEQAGPSFRAARQPPPPPLEPPPTPPPQPFTGFMPRQVRANIGTAVQRPGTQGPGGCGGSGRPCGASRSGTSMRQPEPPREQARGEPPQEGGARRRVTKTSSIKKIVTKRN